MLGGNLGNGCGLHMNWTNVIYFYMSQLVQPFSIQVTMPLQYTESWLYLKYSSQIIYHLLLCRKSLIDSYISLWQFKLYPIIYYCLPLILYKQSLTSLSYTLVCGIDRLYLSLCFVRMLICFSSKTYQNQIYDVQQSYQDHFDPNPRLAYNSLSCLQKPVLGWQQGLFYCMDFRHSSKFHLYFCIMYAISKVEHLEIPAAQCTSTFVFLRASSIKSQAGLNVCRASCVWQSFRSNLRCWQFGGYWKCRSTPEQTAVMLFFYSSLRLCAKSQPLIHTSPKSLWRSSTFCPVLQKDPYENIQIQIINEGWLIYMEVISWHILMNRWVYLSGIGCFYSATIKQYIIMMIRLLAALSVKNVLPVLAQQTIKYKNCLNNNVSVSYFSIEKRHPLIERLAEVKSPAQLDKILIEMTNFNQKNREIAIGLILQKIQSKIFPISLITDKKFLTHLNKHPILLFEAFFCRINQQMNQIDQFIKDEDKKKAKVVVKDTNQSFMICFEALKKMGREQALGSEVALQRKFADYYLLCLLQMVQPAKRGQVLKKSGDVYRSCLNKTSALLTQLKEQLKKASQIMLKLGETQQSRNQEIAQLQQDIVRLVQETSQSTFNLLTVQNLIRDKDQIQNEAQDYREDQEQRIPFEFHQGLVQILPFFKKAAQNYLVIEGQKKFSSLYPKVKKMSLQLSYYQRVFQIQKMAQSQQQQAKLKEKQQQSLLLSLQQLYVETSQSLQCIDKEGKHFKKVQDLGVLLLSIRLYAIQQENLQKDQYKIKLIQEVKKIVALVQEGVKRRLLESRLSNILKQVLDVDAQDELEKQTRTIKLNRRLKL